MKSQRISKNVIRRLPRYIRHLDLLTCEGVTRVSSSELGKRMSLTASQIRQDFNCFGGFGQQGYGYNVEELRSKLAAILGMERSRSAIIIGAGNLGRAIIKNFRFGACGVTLRAAFDIGDKREAIGDALSFYDIGELENYLRENPTDIAVLTLPADAADGMAHRLVGAGIRGIWNFTNVELRGIPENVVVENVHFSDSLLALNYYLSKEEK
ncbi:MAG: redox-sensing transcriptional repressor Rex [Oscillospiraceae bacterium]|nr:redox-sensing transcriptional repressor Rex [Oscillospiraceae bacterium]